MGCRVSADTLAWDSQQSAVPGVARSVNTLLLLLPLTPLLTFCLYRGDELATVWQQWPKANDLDMLFCATDGQNEKPRGGGGGW